MAAAEKRGVYVDDQGFERIVAEGDEVPEGWKRKRDDKLVTSEADQKAQQTAENKAKRSAENK